MSTLALVLVAMLVGVALSEAARRLAPLPRRPRGNHRGPGALDRIGGSLLLVRAKGVYADITGTSAPAKQEKASSHTTSA